MESLVVRLVKIVAACAGPAFILYAIHLFEDHFASGKHAPDVTHTVLVNNHGVYRYITESQDQSFRFFMGAGIVMLLLLFAAIIATKLRRRQ